MNSSLDPDTYAYLTRQFFDAANTGTWTTPSKQQFASEPNWEYLFRYLGGCGLVRPLISDSLREGLQAFAPPVFIENLQRRAVADALRELSHRETLEILHQQLAQLNCRAILLKGAALSLQEEAAKLPPGRVPGDLDIWIETPSLANALRQRLIKAGFLGDPQAPRTAPHHLAPVAWRASAVEIHTAPMPEFWGLPDDFLARTASPVPRHNHFHTLNSTGMILHEAVHCTSHLYSFGLKLPMDILRLHRLAELQKIDWKELTQGADRLPCPLAFWAPMMALQPDFDQALPLPQEFWDAAPTHKRALRCARIARDRMFTTIDNADAMNPFTRNGLFLMLHDTPASRLRYLAKLARGSAAESRRTALSSTGGQSWKKLPAHLRAAWKELKSYRR